MIYPSDADYEYVGREKYRQIAETGTGAVETRFRRKDGAVIDVLLSSTPIDVADLSRGVTFTVMDITARNQAKKTLQKRAEELAALNALSRAANATLSLEQTMAAALQGILNAAYPDLAYLFLREGDKLILKKALPPSAREWLDAIPEHRVGECLCGLAVREKKPLYSLNMFNDSRCTWEECKKAGMKSFAALPLINGDEVIGVIGLASAVERDYERQAGFLETLAGQVSVAVANARLFELVQRELAERKRTEEALRRSEEHFRALIEHSSDMIFIVDKKGTNTYVSPSVERILGYKPEDLTGKSCFHIILPVDVPRAIRDFGEAILTKSVVIPNVFRVRHKDGSERTLEGVGRSLFDHPAVAGFVMNVRDITERKKAEADLLRMHALLNETQALAKLGGWEYDVATKRVAWTDEVHRIYGVGPDYDPNDIDKDMNFYAPESVPILRDAFHRAVDLGEPYDLELEFFRANGERIWVRTMAKPILENGKVARLTGNFVDITERKRAEEALRESEEKHRILLEQSSDPIFSFTPEGRYKYVNRAFAEGVGKSVEDIVGRTIWDVFPKEEADKRFASLSQVFSAGQEKVIEVRVPRADGDRYYVTTITPIKDPKGRVFSAICSSKDITERKKAEEAIREQMNELHRWHEVTLGRETRVLDLKREVNELLAKTGQPPRYESVVADGERSDRNGECGARNAE